MGDKFALFQVRRLEEQVLAHEAQNAVDSMVQLAHALGSLDREMNENQHARVERLIWSAIRGIERHVGVRREDIPLGGYADRGLDPFESRSLDDAAERRAPS